MTDLRSPLSKVRGLGAAGSGTGHFWSQRWTALLLIPLVLWLGFCLASMPIDHGSLTEWIRQPLVTIALMFMTAFPVFNTLSEQLREFVLANMVPEAGSKVITGYVEQFSSNAAKLTAAGVSVFVISSIMLMLTIDKAFKNRISFTCLR